MQKIIPLWEGTAPYSEFSPDQAQPSVKAFPVAGSNAAVVVCPGGAYCMKAAHEGDPVAERLNRGGISAFVLDYRVKPCHHEAPLTDAKRAIRLVRAMGYKYVGILGFSAGGNLCCSAATLYDAGDPDAADEFERLSSRPDFFAPCYAVVSFLYYPHRGSCVNLLGDPPSNELMRRFSAELHITAKTPPAFIWHTASDEGVAVEESLMLARELSKVGVPFEMHIYPEGPHGMGLAENDPVVSDWSEKCVRFIRRLCK